MKNLTETERMVIATSLNNMMNAGRVSICDIDKCLKIAGVLPTHGDYMLLSALHCVYFKDMPAELVAKVPTMIGNCFNGLNIADLLSACVPAGKRGALTLLKS